MNFNFYIQYLIFNIRLKRPTFAALKQVYQTIL